MKNSKWVLSAILLITLISGLIACGGGSQGTAPAEKPTSVSKAEATTPPTDTPQPTDTPVPTDTPPPEPSEGKAELDVTSLTLPSDFESYRSTMSIAVEGTDDGEKVRETIEFLVEYTREPFAQHIIISGEGFEDTEEAGNVEMYQTAETTYMKLGEEWLSTPTSEEDMLADAGMIGPDDVLGDTCGWNKESDTKYNGLKVHHWTFDKKDLEKCITTEQLAELGQLTDASGDLYVAVDTNYVVAMNLIFGGKALGIGMGTHEGSMDEGRMEFTFEMTDVNEPFTIQVPEEALTSGAMPKDIPIPDDAEEVSNVFGMITFSSPGSPEEIADFYKAEMPKNGWTQVSAEEFSGMYMLEYTKENRTASFMINTDTDSGQTSVLITVEENEG